MTSRGLSVVLVVLVLVPIVCTAMYQSFFLIPFAIGMECILLLGVVSTYDMWSWPSATPGADVAKVGQPVLQVTLRGTDSASSSAVEYQAPAKVGQSLPKAAFPAGVGTYDNPVLWSADGVTAVWQYVGQCTVFASVAIDGYGHSFVGKSAYRNVQAAIDDCNAWQAQWATGIGRKVFTVSADTFSQDIYQLGAINVAPFDLCWSGQGMAEPSCSTPGGFGLALDISEPKDGKKRLKIATTGFQPDSADPDWTDAEKASGVARGAAPVLVTEGSASVTELSVVGGKVMLGRAQQEGGNVRTTIVTIAGGSLESASDSTGPGSVAATGAAGLGDNGSGSTGNGTGSAVTFPSDYARAGEAGQAATNLGDRLMIGQEVGDPVAPGSDSWVGFGTNFDALKGWRLPAHSSSCPTPSFDAWGRTFTVSSHCALIADHASALSTAMLVVWSVGALFIVLRA